MKKTLKLISISAFSLLYLFVISFYSSKAFLDNFENTRLSGSEKEQFCSLDFSFSLCHTDKTEGLTTVFAKIPTSFFKNPLKESAAWSRAEESHWFNNFSQYSFYSRTLSISLLHTALIFPFHYFW
ncbi:MAG: hypothetical protein IPI77_23035 [Saprospiraceae bacterium]|nr:hypothetical protein [Saprospiraceae bacterium]